MNLLSNIHVTYFDFNFEVITSWQFGFDQRLSQSFVNHGNLNPVIRAKF